MKKWKYKFFFIYFSLKSTAKDEKNYFSFSNEIDRLWFENYGFRMWALESRNGRKGRKKIQQFLSCIIIMIDWQVDRFWASRRKEKKGTSNLWLQWYPPVWKYTYTILGRMYIQQLPPKSRAITKIFTFTVSTVC